VEHVAAALRSASERRRPRKVADGNLDIEFVDQRRVAGRAYETAHLKALLHQALRQVPADEPSRARDEANVVTRRIDGLAAKWRPIDHRNVHAWLADEVAVAISRTTAQFLLAAP